MKILHFSDVHGDLAKLGRIRDIAHKLENPIVVCSGDLIGDLLDQEKARKMNAGLGYILQNRTFSEGADMNQIIRSLAEQKVDEDLQSAAINFLAAEAEYKRMAVSQYQEIEKILGTFPDRKMIMAVNGNWDSMDYFDHIDSFSLHPNGKVRKETRDGLTFAGFGNALEVSLKIPPSARIPHSSEKMYDYLSQLDADIVVTHAFPLGKSLHGCRPEFALHSYIGRYAPDLVLCGHSHVPSLIHDTNDKTIVVNAGNLGTYGNDKSGYFAVIEGDVKDDSFSPKSISHHQIIGSTSVSIHEKKF